MAYRDLRLRECGCDRPLPERGERGVWHCVKCGYDIASRVVAKLKRGGS